MKDYYLTIDAAKHLAMMERNEQGKLVRTIEVEGEVWFVASDVAKALGYAKPENAIERHCKGTLKRGILTRGGVQSMSTIPERDVYRLVIARPR